jgi:hypothetical protein
VGLYLGGVRATIITLLSALLFMPSLALAQTATSDNSSGGCCCCLVIVLAVIAVVLYLGRKKPKRNVPAPIQTTRTDTAYNTSSYSYPAPSQIKPSDIDEAEVISEANQYSAYADIFDVSGLTESEKDIMQSAGPDYIEELKKLAELKNNGTLTEEEFQREKKEILYRANKLEKIPCAYCGSAIDVYLDKCPSCGAPLKADKGE